MSVAATARHLFADFAGLEADPSLAGGLRQAQPLLVTLL